MATLDSDILIVGGGVIGMSIARELHKRGFGGEITLVEKGPCGEESSWAAAGMLGAQAETDEPGDMLRMCLLSRGLYPQFAAELLDETGIDIELDRKGTLYLAFNDSDSEQLRTRVEWQTGVGMNATILTGAEARRTEPFISPDVAEAAFFPDDWQVDNRKLCLALRRYLELNGVAVLENTEVLSLTSEAGSVAGVRTVDSEFRAGMTVLAAGAWTALLKLRAFPMPLFVKPIRGQMIAYRSAKRLFQHVLYCSTGYIVPRADGRLLCGATSEDAGYVKLNTDEAVAGLIESAEKIAPSLMGHQPIERWSGLRPRSADELPVLGQIDGVSGLMVATGHYRNGILLAPATAAIIADAASGGPRSDFLQIFGPQRFRSATSR
jgi:glycine oxidase